MQNDLDGELDSLRQCLSRQLSSHCAADPYVQHLRWQIGCLERSRRPPGPAARRISARPPAPKPREQD